MEKIILLPKVHRCINSSAIELSITCPPDIAHSLVSKSGGVRQDESQSSFTSPRNSKAWVHMETHTLQLHRLRNPELSDPISEYTGKH